MSKFRQYDNYEVYDDGKIWSYKRNKWLKPITLKNGYQRVWLYNNEGKRKIYLLHRIVYETFSGEPIPNNLQINHIDENKENNARTNLELVLPKENCNWGSRNVRISKANTNNKKLSKSLTNNPKKSKPVGAFKDGNLVMTFPSANEARRNGFEHSHIVDCCNGKRKTHRGFEWKYL